MPWREKKTTVGVIAGGEGFSWNNSKMSEIRILVRLLRMYFPWNWEFGSALSKLRNFGGGLNTPNPPSVHHCNWANHCLCHSSPLFFHSYTMCLHSHKKSLNGNTPTISWQWPQDHFLYNGSTAIKTRDNNTFHWLVSIWQFAYNTGTILNVSELQSLQQFELSAA